jgi:site-specific DNA-cytosine methylase
MNENIKWIPHIPLIGGFPLGAEKAIGHAPEFIASLPGFLANDSHYINYQNTTLSRNLDYKVLEPDDHTFKEKINIVVGTPPCAALSQLNTGTSVESKGADCAKNDFMYMVAEHGIHCYDADVILIENAPALYTNKGKDVADRLYAIAKKNNYALTLYKTSTSYHGIPQNRDRTFAIFWKGGKAPIMNWYERDRKIFEEYLKEVPTDALQQEIVINPAIGNESYFNFIKNKVGKDVDARDAIIEGGFNTAFNYVNKKGLLQEAINWFRETGDAKGLKYAEHAAYKFSIGKGIWDGSTHVFKNSMNAVIGRNMNDTIHPTENRSLTIREALYMMGFPLNFELVGGRSKLNHIAQNVPVVTAADMVSEAVKFLKGELTMSNTDFVKQNNHKKCIDVGDVEQNTLEAFF